MRTLNYSRALVGISAILAAACGEGSAGAEGGSGAGAGQASVAGGAGPASGGAGDSTAGGTAGEGNGSGDGDMALCESGLVYVDGSCLAEGQSEGACTVVTMAERGITAMALGASALFYVSAGTLWKLDLASGDSSVVSDEVPWLVEVVKGESALYLLEYGGDQELLKVEEQDGLPVRLATVGKWASSLTLHGSTLYYLQDDGGLTIGLHELMSFRLDGPDGASPAPVGDILTQSYLVDDDKLFVTMDGGGYHHDLRAAPLSTPSELTDLTTGVFANRLLSDEDSLYWATSTFRTGSTSTEFYRVPKSGGLKSSLLTADRNWRILHQDNSTLYVLEYESRQQPGAEDEVASVIRLPLGVPASQETFTRFERSWVSGATTDAQHVWLAVGSALVRCAK